MLAVLNLQDMYTEVEQISKQNVHKGSEVSTISNGRESFKLTKRNSNKRCGAGQCELMFF